MRVREHMQKGSKSAISLHIKAENDAGAEIGEHEVKKDATVVLTQERNARKRRFIESAGIRAKQPKLCNTGTSVTVSDTWAPNIAHLPRSLPGLDEQRAGHGLD